MQFPVHRGSRGNSTEGSRRSDNTLKDRALEGSLPAAVSLVSRLRPLAKRCARNEKSGSRNRQTLTCFLVVIFVCAVISMRSEGDMRPPPTVDYPACL